MSIEIENVKAYIPLL